MCFPRPSCHPPLLSPFSSSCAWDHPGRERVPNLHVRVKGRRRKTDFPYDLEVLVRVFFPLLLAVSAVTAVTTGPGLAPSPTLPLPGRAQSTGSQISSSAGGWRLLDTFLLAQKKRKNCLAQGQMADCFLAAPLQWPFSYCPDKHMHAHTHREQLSS